jgi:hypothetical protein
MQTERRQQQASEERLTHLSGRPELRFTKDVAGITSSEEAVTNEGELRIATRQLARSFQQ